MRDYQDTFKSKKRSQTIEIDILMDDWISSSSSAPEARPCPKESLRSGMLNRDRDLDILGVI
jgi:hypothetical protein